ncbi:phosphotransferase family protein [Phytohabitans kaempferiae]|uniref:Phosphotransferase family protein n=1 Tax=Phytohabitans kaempferiae TaxID=1620943 RepID=A0ABV6MBJ0_9ACTN
MTRVPDVELTAVLATAGVTGPHTALVPLAAGEDNQVYATAVAGRDLVVKAARTSRVRSGVAAWAAVQLAAVGVPAPTVLGYRGRLLVETRCPGNPLDQHHADHAQSAELAAQAGRLLRRIHTVPVRGYGRLDTVGVGLRPCLHSWLLQLPPLPTTATADMQALRAQALQALRHHLPLLAGVPAVLLHGDWTARHVIVKDGRISGVVDLESVRGGDPLADLAGWSLQEPAELTHGLYTGYFTTAPDPPTRMRLALYRVRIAAAMLAQHVAKAEPTQLTLRTAQLQADLADLSCQQPAAHPRITPPPPPIQEGPPC